MKKIVAAALCLLLSACSMARWNEKLSTPEDRKMALHTIADLRAGNATALSKIMDPELFAETRTQFASVAKSINAPGTPALVTVAKNVMTGPTSSRTITCLNYEYGAEKRWILAEICIQADDYSRRVIGWHAWAFDQRPSAANDLSFGKLGWLGYLWILAMIGALGTTLTGAILAIRSKGIKFRWLWAISSLLGFAQFAHYFGTEAWAIRPIYVSLLGAAILRTSPLQPWMASFSLPVVAIIFMLLRKRLLPKTSKEPDVTAG